MEKKSKGMVIAVSGPPSAGSSTIAMGLAKKLKLKFFAPGLIEKKHGKSYKQSEAALKGWQTRTVKSKKFHQNLDKLQIEIAKKGGVVICGKLSIHFLKGIADFTIWLDVPLKVRAKRAVERDKIPLKEAMAKISERERIERKEWKRIYGFDYFDQKKQADIVFDSSGLAPEQTVNKIFKLIQKI